MGEIYEMKGSIPSGDAYETYTVTFQIWFMIYTHWIMIYDLWFMCSNLISDNVKTPKDSKVTC